MLDKVIAQEVLETLVSTGGDFAEIYEEKKHADISFETSVCFLTLN